MAVFSMHASSDDLLTAAGLLESLSYFIDEYINRDSL